MVDEVIDVLEREDSLTGGDVFFCVGHAARAAANCFLGIARDRKLFHPATSVIQHLGASTHRKIELKSQCRSKRPEDPEGNDYTKVAPDCAAGGVVLHLDVGLAVDGVRPW